VAKTSEKDGALSLKLAGRLTKSMAQMCTYSYAVKGRCSSSNLLAMPGLFRRMMLYYFSSLLLIDSG
jgi:hypothetical protein